MNPNYSQKTDSGLCETKNRHKRKPVHGLCPPWSLSRNRGKRSGASDVLSCLPMLSDADGSGKYPQLNQGLIPTDNPGKA